MRVSSEYSMLLTCVDSRSIDNDVWGISGCNRNKVYIGYIALAKEIHRLDDAPWMEYRAKVRISASAAVFPKRSVRHTYDITITPVGSTALYV